MENFIRVAAITPKIKLAKPLENIEIIFEELKKAEKNGAKIITSPELSLVGYTISDLFLQKELIVNSFIALYELAEMTKNLDCFFAVGLPVWHKNMLFNCVAAVKDGKILGIVPKTYLPNSQEYYEKRWFNSAEFLNDDYDTVFPPFYSPFYGDILSEKLSNEEVIIYEPDIPFGSIVFQLSDDARINIGIEICEDLFAPIPPSTFLALKGATIILNSSASIETIGKDEYRKNLVKMQSGSSISAYIYANAGAYESSQDAVFSGHNIIAENGQILAENELWTDSAVFADIDITAITHDRMVSSSFRDSIRKYETDKFAIRTQPFIIRNKCKKFNRKISKTPFVPIDKIDRGNRAKEILEMQSRGIIKRFESSKAEKLVVGISGGLDSTLAFLSCVYAMDKLNIDRKNIIALTMPAFGTTERTKDNAIKLAKTFGCSFEKIDIRKTVLSHFKDIKQDEDDFDTTYENVQARVRTLTLFDKANKENGILIGTGDLSELALGWTTFGGDHLSSYSVNAGIPKTLVKYIIEYYMEIGVDFFQQNKEKMKLIKKVLSDILATPISPELLPPMKNGEISQKTEDLIGPYILHDFFLYHFLRYGRTKEEIFKLADYAFSFEREIIEKWLTNFYKRFYSNQFKRSCLPDGLKVGSVSLSPRADFRMPSDL
ncbi:MAG: NAD(+) synthase [Clostridiales Family XIII bacterium]|jgi:NAD+ synthase (glutamine-hydrolysing)|nr:NAD(+) synthase [Clostridiales Family XIII bacterium]